MQQHNKDIDKWLTSMGYYRKLLAHDETCLFRAVSEQIFSNQLKHENIRIECVKYANKNRCQFNNLVLDWEEYFTKLKNHMVVCGYVEIQIISKRYEYDFIIFDANTYRYRSITNNQFSRQILLCLCGDDHFDNVYKKDYIEDSAFCQSIIYNILYKDVFKLENIDNIVETMLYDKSHEKTYVSASKMDKFVDSIVADKSNNLKKVLISTPFSYKVAKALDPNIYRNISFDTWGEFRREWRLSSWYQGDLDFKVGTRCILKLKEGDINKQYHCYIQKMDQKDHPIYVYIEELAKFKYVNYDQLEPEPDAKPWLMPYRYLKQREKVVIEKDQTVAVYKKGRNRKNNTKNNTQNKIDDNNNNPNCIDCVFKRMVPFENDSNSAPRVASNNMKEENLTLPDNQFSFDSSDSACKVYLQPKSFDPYGHDQPQDHSALPYFYNMGFDFYRVQMFSMPMYQTFHEYSAMQYNITEQNNDFTYFTHVTTETSYLMQNPQNIEWQHQESFIKTEEPMSYVNPNVLSQTISPYPYMYYPFPISFNNYTPPSVPPNSPNCPQLMSLTCPIYNGSDQFVFPPEYLSDA